MKTKKILWAAAVVGVIVSAQIQETAYSQASSSAEHAGADTVAIVAADVDFAKGMLPHHQAAVVMAEAVLKYGKDETVRQLAKDMLVTQKAEIALMQTWLTAHLQDFSQTPMARMAAMHGKMMSNAIVGDDADMAFATGMIPHHQGGVLMAEYELAHGKDETLRQLAKDIIAVQQAEIELMQQWIAQHKE